jgi:hypothetical protein
MLGRLAGALLLAAALSSCSQQRPLGIAGAPSMPPDQHRIEANQLSWWKVRFRINWPGGTERDQAVVLMLADAVVKPVLREHEDELLWWRFHRRAARDGAGHQFSYMFYTSQQTAAQTIRAIRQSEVLAAAIDAGMVKKVIYPDTCEPDRPQLEDYSDPSWPLPIQRTWPSYIMGVSAMWLGLIEEMKQGDTADETDIYALYDQYKAINESVMLAWYADGQHAFLHHLSAVFGYEPMLIRKEIRF